MRSYRDYLIDVSKTVPKSTKNYQKRKRREQGLSSSDDSSHYPQRLDEQSSDSNLENINRVDVSPALQSEPSIQHSDNYSLTNENMDFEVLNDEQNSTLLTSQVYSERLSVTTDSNRNQVFGFSDSEERQFQNSWIFDTYDEFLEQNNEDEDDNDDDDNNEDDDEDYYDALPHVVENEYNFNDIYNECAFNPLLKFLRKSDNTEKINAKIKVSKCEILLAVLTFGLTYSLPQSAIADLLKMLNSFFGFSLLPDTRYYVNKLFNSEGNVEYHAVCPRCKKYVQKFDFKTRCIECNLCKNIINLKDPTYCNYFTIMNIKNQIADLLENNSTYLNFVFNKRLEEDQNFNDIYDGVCYKRFTNSLSADDRMNCVTTTFNSDGSPVFESSKFSIWPIQFIINELPYHIRTSKNLVCGMWFGKDKPDMNIFLNPFVNYMNELANEGVRCIINNVEQYIKVYTLCCCVDSVARAPMQGIMQFNGHFGCNWCLHPGVYVHHGRGGSIKYVLLNETPAKRTALETLHNMEQSLHLGNPVCGVKGPTPLVNLIKFDIISGFVPDSMHCINEGIAEQFLDYWITSNVLSNDDLRMIENLLLNIKVPNQITRLSRSIMDRKWWKAREWENWVLYYSVPILLYFPRCNLWVKHWALLVEAYHLLLKSSITRDELYQADTLLKEFVVKTELYYSQTAMSFNVHQLLHLTQSVVDWGPLWAHSGYCFENGNGTLVRKIHSAKGVIKQLCRTLSMNESQLILKRCVELDPFSNVSNFIHYLENKETKNTLKISDIRYVGFYRNVPERIIEQLNLSIESRRYAKMVKDGCLYTSIKNRRIRSNNSFALMKDGTFIRIIDFVVDIINRKEYIVCNIVTTRNIFDGHSFTVKQIASIVDDITYKETNNINRICIMMTIEDVMYISPIPNLYHY